MKSCQKLYLLIEKALVIEKKKKKNHVLIRLIQDWKKSLENKNIFGAVLTDLPKASGCIPHDLLKVKMSVYGFSTDTLVFM